MYNIKIMSQELSPQPIETSKVKKPRKLSTVQQIIIKHVVGMGACHDKGIWGREGRIASTLIKKYGADFLLWISPLENYQVQSMTFYYSVRGRNHLSDQLVEYSKHKGVIIPEKKEMVTAESKIGEDVTPIPKPKTLKEFLNYGKEIRRLTSTTRN